jgi:hypothetical protein
VVAERLRGKSESFDKSILCNPLVAHWAGGGWAEVRNGGGDLVPDVFCGIFRRCFAVVVGIVDCGRLMRGRVGGKVTTPALDGAGAVQFCLAWRS